MNGEGAAWERKRTAGILTPWRDGAEAVPGPDEDATTMAVAASSGVIEAVGADGVTRVVVVTRAPALLEGPTTAVIGPP